MHEHALLILRPLHAAVYVPLRFAKLRPRNVLRLLMPYGLIPGYARVFRRNVGQKQPVVAYMRAHARVPLVPPVHNVTFLELVRRAFRYVPPHALRLRIHKRKHILQLVAEARRPAALIVSCFPQHSGGKRLIAKPPVHQRIKPRVGRFYPYHAKLIPPRGLYTIKLMLYIAYALAAYCRHGFFIPAA